MRLAEFRLPRFAADERNCGDSDMIELCRAIGFGCILCTWRRRSAGGAGRCAGRGSVITAEACHTIYTSRPRMFRTVRLC